MAVNAAAIRQEIRNQGDPAIAARLQQFFKTGKGEYGEGDRFHGVRVPAIRRLVRKYRDAPLAVIITLLESRWHEERMFAVLSMANRFKTGDEKIRRTIFDAYMQNLRCVNNWDLVDASCHVVIGGWLESRDRALLYKFARSHHLWERRIAIISTFHYIRYDDFADALAIAEILLHDKEDLIHKATGWMLREIGNRHRPTEERFLKQHYHTMPRTMLRYAIEKFPEGKRQAYLKGIA